MHKKFLCLLLAAATFGLAACGTQIITSQPKEGAATMAIEYRFPAEESAHEGTWLTWPHHYTYGMEYREEVEGIWLAMVDALHTGERVHIIAYDEAERRRIARLLEEEAIDMTAIDFVIARSDDVWTRDTGPMFVFDDKGKPTIADFAFDGWGGNEVVLLPVYGDRNDAAAAKILSALYASRKIIPIDVTALYQYGGMLHCVTQQQPKG